MVACAGHPPPLLIPRDGPPRLADCEHDVVLGVIGATLRGVTFAFARGDRLVLYTDGLVERPGERSTTRSSSSCGPRPGVHGLAPLRAHIVARLVGGEEPRDDVALLLAERCVH